MKTIGHTIIPEPEKRWEQGGVKELKVIGMENGRDITVPVFDSFVKSIELLDSKYIEAKDGSVTEVLHYEVVTGNGYLRHVKVYLPPKQKCEEAEFTIHLDVPYCTGEAGHNERVGVSLTQSTDQPSVVVGPEEFPEHNGILYVLKNLGKVATDASSISLAQSAEDSTAILEAIMELHPELPRDVIVPGESRAAMLAPAKHHAAEARDIHNRYYDLTDPCLPDGAFGSIRTTIQLARFLPSEAMHALPVGLDMLLDGTIFDEKGTVPTRAQYFGAAILGTGPALLNGEAGRLPSMLPDGTPVHIANFRSNPIANHSRWRELYSHTDFAGVNLRGAHLGLAYLSVLDHVAERINRLVYEKQTVGKIEYVDFRRVHRRDDQKYIGASEHMLAAA